MDARERPDRSGLARRNFLADTARAACGAGVAWLPDGSGFFHSRLAPDWEKRPRAERFLDNTVFLRTLADPTREVAVFGPTVHPELGLARSDGASVRVLEDQPLGVAVVAHGVSRYRSLYVSDKDALLAGKPVSVPATQPYGCTVKYAAM